MTLLGLNLECKFWPNACAEYKWAQRIKQAYLRRFPAELGSYSEKKKRKCRVLSVHWVLTLQRRRGEERRGSKVRSPERRLSQRSVSPLDPLSSRGHPLCTLCTCWLRGCVLRLQTCTSRGLSPVSWLLLALQTPSKGDTCAAPPPPSPPLF